MSGHKKIILVLAALILLTPLGLITQNPAWGEWGEEELVSMIGFVPQGIKTGGWFEAPFADYSFLPVGEIGGYIFSATLGSMLIIALFYALKKAANVKK